jgi:lipoprotein signal peptidase/peroxiredoxin
MSLSKSDWIKLVILPFAIVFAIDQLTKYLAQAGLMQIEFGPLTHIFHKNHGVMLGSMNDFSKMYTTVVPATLAGFVLFIFFSVQYFLPIKSASLRIGGSIFCGGVAANIFDRIRFGYVIDFLHLRFGQIETGIFNFADLFQLLGVGFLVFGFLTNEKLLYPTNEKRGRLWVKPKFQLRYCLTLIGSGFAFSLVAGLMSYSFLSVTVSQITGLEPIQISKFVHGYVQIYTMMSLTFFILLFYFGVKLSHRIAGPIAGFESYLDSLVNGKFRTFKVRETDEFKELDNIALKFYEHFHKSSEFEPNRIQEGSYLPAFVANTAQNDVFNSASFDGKKAWIILYRYATCPLCVTHLNQIRDLIKQAKSAGVVVLAVYESTPEDFRKSECANISKFYREVDIQLISDPKREVYLKFKAQRSFWALFHFSNIGTLLKAKKNGYLEPSTVDGDIGQLPAQFLINSDGKVVFSHYGKHFNDWPSESQIETFINSR